MKRVVPVAVGLAAGMAAGFFLGEMVTRHDEPIVVIHNATDETLRWVSIQTDFHPTWVILAPWFIRRVPKGATYSFNELQPHHTSTMRLSLHTPTGLKVDATTAGGKKLSSEKVNVASRDVVFALISSDGIKLQSERLIVGW
jgi:hypothetical protein